MAGWREAVAVAVGGMVGTGLRLGLDTVIPHTDTTFPVSTLLVNVLGSFALGLLVSTLWRRAVPNWLKVGLGTGTVGSFTTFSAVMVSLLAEVHSGLWMLPLVYFALTMVLGFGAAVLGLRLGRPPASRHLELDPSDRPPPDRPPSDRPPSDWPPVDWPDE